MLICLTKEELITHIVVATDDDLKEWVDRVFGHVDNLNLEDMNLPPSKQFILSFYLWVELLIRLLKRRL